MMRLAICKEGLLVTLALAVGVQACSAVAAETDLKLAPTREFSPATRDFFLSGFDIRWSGDQDDRLVSSGTISPQASLEAASRHNTEHYLFAETSGWLGFDTPQPSEARRSKQFDNYPYGVSPAKTTVTAGVCGPSPLGAEEIRALVVAAARRFGVDQDLAVAIVAAESNFDQNRNSPKGARGPMQLMPTTAARFGVADSCEPAANIDAGVRYLGLLLDEFVNPILAIAAYNAGEDRIYEYGGIPPFPETVNYVATVLNHQLGLQTPRRKPVKALRSGGPDEPFQRGVVATGKPRQWVAGVMEF